MKRARVLALVSIAVTWSVARADPRQLHAAAQAADTMHCSSGTCPREVVALYEQAAAAYAEALVKSPDDAEARFLRAEILHLKLGRYEEAGDEYARAAAAQPAGKYVEDALLGAVAAYDLARGASAGPVDDKLVAAANRYLERFAGGPRTPGVSFVIAQLQLDRGRLAEAAQRFEAIVTRYPHDPNAGPAGDRWLTTLSRANDYAGIERAVGMLRALPAFADAAREKLLDGLAIAAIEKQAEAAQRVGRAADAAAAYRRAASTAHDDATRARELSNAAAALAKSGALVAARDAYLDVANRFLHDRLASAALWEAAHLDETLCRWDEAATGYQRLATVYPRDDHALDALFNAGVLRRALGQRDAARVAFEQYAALGAARRDADVVALEAAKLEGTPAALEAVARRDRTGHFVGTALVLAARAAIAAGDNATAAKDLAAALARWKALAAPARSSDRSGPEARYLQGELAAAASERVALAVTGKLASLRATVDARVRTLRAATDILADVATYRDAEWTIAAQYRTGEAYEAFGAALDAVPPPAGLSPDEVKAYKEQLESVSMAMRDRVVAAYRAAYDLGLALPLFSEQYLAARTALIRLGVLAGDDEARGAVIVEPAPEIRWIDLHR